MSDWTSHGWEAVQDHQPPGPENLRVTGTIHAPRGGYEFRLRPAEPQGANEKDLRMELDVKEPEFGPAVETDYPIRWRDDVAIHYDTVTIAGVDESIKVEHVY